MSANDDVVATGPCCRCGAPIRLPGELYRSAKRSPAISFWCAYGHEQHFPAGETEADKLRRERDRLTQKLAEKDDDIARERRMREREREEREAAERRASAARGQVTKLKKRASNGVCPCCNRTFGDLARHMATKHPTFLAEESPGDGAAKH
jgi:hypothetical protein